VSGFQSGNSPNVDSVLRNSPALLSAAPATTGQTRAALAVVLLVLVACLATLPFAQLVWISFPGFILIQQTLQAGNSLIIAALLFGQHAVARTASLNILAGGYLFTALMIVAHALSFPGAFSQTGLIGGPQSTSWLYTAWHAILPVTIIVYALIPPDENTERPYNSARQTIVSSILICVGGATAITLLMTAGHDWLPALVQNGRLMPASIPAVVGLLLLASGALLVVIQKKPRSLLDLWLIATMSTWLCTIATVSLVSAQRFDIGWYVGRMLDVLSSTFILLLLLYQTAVLYERNALAISRERRERERRLNESEAILIHLSRVSELGHDVSSIVHEVSQPLAAISNYAAASLKFLETSKPEQAKILLERLVEQTVRATDVIRHMREFVARHQSEKHLENIPKLLRDAARLVLDAAGEHGPAVEIRCDPEASAAFFDRVQIEQVVLNLVRNAIEAMSSGVTRKLTLSTKLTSDRMIEISVADTGPGVSADIRARLFEPFVTTKESGLGIGLSICRVIVEAHGGKLTAEDNPAGGAIFRFTIPN
jgi:signal transduction histidine kinase